jgi:hypothetical protein
MHTRRLTYFGILIQQPCSAKWYIACQPCSACAPEKTDVPLEKSKTFYSVQIKNPLSHVHRYTISIRNLHRLQRNTTSVLVCSLHNGSHISGRYSW